MKKTLFWLPTLAWMGVIFYFSNQPKDVLISLFPFEVNFDLGHLVMYFILALLCFYSLNKTSRNKYLYTWVLLIVFTYGISDEFHQSFIPGRTSDVFDLIMDTTGSFLALIIIAIKSKISHFNN